MSNDKTTGSNQIPAAAESKLERLLELLLAREATNLEVEAANKIRQKARNETSAKSERQNAYNLMLLMSKCKHLKGNGKRGGKQEGINADRVADPNLMCHTFIDQTSVIKCLTCGARWKKFADGSYDTAEYLWRGGKRVPNVTKKGWPEMVDMMNRSTNMPSSSEVPFNQRAGSNIPESFSVPDGFEY